MERAVIDPFAKRTLISEKVVCRISVKAITVTHAERIPLVIAGNYGSSDTVETYTEKVEWPHTVKVGRSKDSERISRTTIDRPKLFCGGPSCN